jgi:hypothetical protein
MAGICSFNLVLNQSKILTKTMNEDKMTQKTFYLNKRLKIPKGQSQKDNPEKLALYIGHTRRRKTKQKHNTS